MNEQLTDMAHVGDRSLGINYESKPEGVTFPVKPVRGRFSCTVSSQPSSSRGHNREDHQLRRQTANKSNAHKSTPEPKSSSSDAGKR